MKTTKSWCVRCFKHQIILNTEFHSITGWWWWRTGTYKNTFLLSVYEWNAWILYFNYELECYRWFYDVWWRVRAGRQTSRRWRTPEQIVTGDFQSHHLEASSCCAASKFRFFKVLTSNGDNPHCLITITDNAPLGIPSIFLFINIQPKSSSKTATNVAMQSQTE